ncbi:hypothetical protein KIH41_12745 [Litoribacter ruber]|uniref:Uncharacterized protein n=1 Tax=Litoribacter ruber TaxID=702568 RepID=A0AAP2CI09_9BACT|nr:MULTISPECIES: hypothetical protein [Litoribacter]MBS9523631.1 hypothetical protein [Litoribacter alkaliphilus]MBT0812145.1 hypothetical protein [Litoribacter ruber]
MSQDLITKTLKTYFIKKGKSLKVIQRYLSVKYRMHIEEKILRKRLQDLRVN